MRVAFLPQPQMPAYPKVAVGSNTQAPVSPTTPRTGNILNGGSDAYFKQMQLETAKRRMPEVSHLSDDAIEAFFNKAAELRHLLSGCSNTNHSHTPEDASSKANELQALVAKYHKGEMPEYLKALIIRAKDQG